MAPIFDGCVRLLVSLAGWIGITYKQINVWIFVILWPIASLAMAGVILRRAAVIRRLRRQKVDR